MSRPITILGYGGHIAVRERFLVVDMAEVPWTHCNSTYPSTNVILPRIWPCRHISYANIAGFTFWFRESASSSGLTEWFSCRQAYSKMINDGRGKRCLRCQSRGILVAVKKLEPSTADMTEMVLASFRSHSHRAQQQALLLASSDTVDTREVHVRISSALA